MKTFYILAMLAGLLQTTAPQQSPTLSKEESLTLENIQLRSAIVNQEIKDLQARTNAAKEEIEKAHPGYTLTQTQQGFQLMKTPEPSKNKEKEKPKPASPPQAPVKH